MLYRAVLPGEWEEIVQPLGVTGTIVVEASPWVEDNQWLLNLADRYVPAPGMQGIVGIVGSLPLGDAAFAQLVKRFTRHRLFRGIRASGEQTLAALAAGEHEADLRVLADHDLVLDLNGGDIMAAATAAARLVPQLRVMIDHMGQPGISPGGPKRSWQDAIAKAAEQPNVFLKVSGLLESAAGSHPDGEAPTAPDFYAPWLDCVWRHVGPERLAFGSNWPVSDKAGSYADVLGIVRPYVRARGARRRTGRVCRNQPTGLPLGRSRPKGKMVRRDRLKDWSAGDEGAPRRMPLRAASLRALSPAAMIGCNSRCPKGKLS